MKNLKYVILLSIATVLSVAVFSLLRTSQPQKISHSNFKLIKLGMPKKDVEQIIGEPRWEVKPRDPLWIDPTTIDCNVFHFPEEWWGEEGVIRVWYVNDVVSNLEFAKHRCEISPLSVWERWDHFWRPVPRKENEEEKLDYLEQ